MMFGKHIFILLISFLAAGFTVLAEEPQDDAQAARIYKNCASSVLFLTVKSETGEVVGQATGFVIKGGTIVTNEHVTRKGKVFVETGVAVIPTVMARVDSLNDLAFLTPVVELAAAPLVINDSLPSPGNPVFTISNPAGLDKSISAGIVASVRELEGRELIQITSPISPGSSGGPVLNERGEVVGVAFGSLNAGQNLNFAVPAKKILDLMRGAAAEGADISSLLDQAKSLNSDLTTLNFSSEEDSEYQRTWAKMRSVFATALQAAGRNLADLMALCNLASTYASDIAVLAAERAVEIVPSFETKFKLGQALDIHSYWLEDPERASVLKRAEIVFRDCLKLSKAPNAEVLKALADVLENQENYSEAARHFTDAYNLFRSGDDVQNEAACLRGLIRACYALGNNKAGDSWFRTLVDSGRATYWDWSRQGERLENSNEFHEAALCYRTAASLNTEFGWSSWLSAARMFWMTEDDYDDALTCARKCISSGSGRKNSEGTLAYSYRLIADILNKRGVYQEALNHARESIALDPEKGWAYDAQAEALIGLRRYLEATKASEQAIRFSDGKFPEMHFRLGYAQFKLENWEQAYQSYKLVVAFDKEDTASPYNLALCAIRMNNYYDAAKWFEEVLRRNPNHPQRQDILKRIEILRR